MNTKITSLNKELANLKMVDDAITESISVHGKAWSPDARKQLVKHQQELKHTMSEYGLDGYEWMFSNDRGML